ncbi:MAG: DUF3800 domain-containing protein [Caulobacterales bacterium]
MPLKQYRLYLDESGTEDYACVDDQGGRHLSLVGVIMEHAHAHEATANLNKIRAQFFDRHPDEGPVIFHRTDIQRRRNAFKCLNDDEVRKEFDRWWLRYLWRTNYRVICITIDKLAMQKKENWQLKHPYHYGMSLMAEKYAQYLIRAGGHGDIMPEARGKRKDQALQAAFDRVRAYGTQFVSGEVIQERLPAKSLKFRSKADNVTGLQIADSLTKAAQDFVLLRRKVINNVSPFTTQIHGVLEVGKFDRNPTYGTIWGYGIKFLP